MRPGAVTWFNGIGNRIINRTFMFIHGQDFHDVLSGYRVFIRESFLDITLTSDGSGIEMEMTVECAKRGIKTTIVPTTYYPRPDGSDTNLDSIHDGGITFLELYRRVGTNNPPFYFGSVRFASAATEFGLVLYVAYEWIVCPISHEAITVVPMAGTLFGVQLSTLGILSGLTPSLHRKQTRRIEELE